MGVRVTAELHVFVQGAVLFKASRQLSELVRWLLQPCFAPNSWVNVDASVSNPSGWAELCTIQSTQLVVFTARVAVHSAVRRGMRPCGKSVTVPLVFLSQDASLAPGKK